MTELVDSPLTLSRKQESITSAVPTQSKRKRAKDTADLASLQTVPVAPKIQDSVRKLRDFPNVHACPPFMARDQECLQNDGRFASGIIEPALFVLRLQESHDTGKQDPRTDARARVAPLKVSGSKFTLATRDRFFNR